MWGLVCVGGGVDVGAWVWALGVGTFVVKCVGKCVGKSVGKCVWTGGVEMWVMGT